MNKVGVVIVTMNNLAMTKQAVASISTVKHQLRTVLVDNGSTDGTVEWAKAYGFDNLILNEENQGVAIAWNQGIMDCYLASCDYIMVMNNDIVLDPDCLDTLVQKFIDNPNSPIILRTYEGGFSCFVLTPHCWEVIGKFDEHFSLIGKAYFEDNDYARRIVRANYNVVSLKTAHAKHAMSKTRDQFGPKKHELFKANRDYYLLKWGGLPGKEKYILPFDGRPMFRVKLVKHIE